MHLSSFNLLANSSHETMSFNLPLISKSDRIKMSSTCAHCHGNCETFSGFSVSILIQMYTQIDIFCVRFIYTIFDRLRVKEHILLETTQKCGANDIFATKFVYFVCFLDVNPNVRIDNDSCLDQLHTKKCKSFTMKQSPFLYDFFRLTQSFKKNAVQTRI